MSDFRDTIEKERVDFDICGQMGVRCSCPALCRRCKDDWHFSRERHRIQCDLCKHQFCPKCMDKAWVFCISCKKQTDNTMDDV